jgi:hypothetical protein
MEEECAIRTKWVIGIDFIYEMLLKEVFGEGPCVAQTLKSCVHVASVS